MRNLLTLFFVLSLNLLISQPKEINYSNWLFGNKAGITFNTPDRNPIEIFTNIDTLKSNEGICTYSDDSGNIKLVSNGKRLVHFFDKDNLTKYKIFEYNNILRKTSSTNSTIILPSLSNPNQFYVFIVGEFDSGNNNTEFSFGIFDTSMDSGLGKFKQDLKVINDSVSEKLAVVYDYNYNWYWIVTTTYKDFGNTKLLFYKLDEYGLNENPIDIDALNKFDVIGDLKFSNTGKYLVICGYDSYNLDLYKFDFQNCKIENVFTYKNSKYRFYGTEFSENDDKLFYTYIKLENKEQYGYIEQFTLLGNSYDIIASKTNIKKNSLFFGNIKRGIDNKLYIPTKEYFSVYNPNYNNNINNYLTVLDNIDLSVDKISDSKLKFNDNRYPIFGIQTAPTILNEKKNCTPDISVYLTDKEVMIGDEFCINGVYIPECEEENYLDSLVIYFEYDPRLLKFESASTDFEIIKLQDKYIIKLKFDEMDFVLNQENEFDFCFTALLGNSKVTVLEVEENDDYNLIDYTNSNISFISCDQPFRQIKLIIKTDFEVSIINEELKINLSTEESGQFEFIIIDLNGKILQTTNFTTNKDEYLKEEILIINLEDLPSGSYFIRMITPNGKFYTKQFIKV